jgi:hypothetical protein
MATVVRAPFWVPRPPDDYLWIGKPYLTATLQQSLHAAPPQHDIYLYNVDFFGLGVQTFLVTDPTVGFFVPTVAGTPFGNVGYAFSALRYYDDASFWQGIPIGANPNIFRLVAVNPVENRQTYWYSEDAFWQGKPGSSAAIPLLSAVKFYGAGGQIPPYGWDFTIDDPPSWQWPLYERNQNILQPAAQAPFENRQVFWYSEDAFWQGRPVGVNLTSRQVPFENRQTYWYSEDAVWVGKPNASAIIPALSAVKVYGVGGQVPPFRWNATLDEPPSWQWPIYAVNLGVHALLAAPTPFENRQTYWYSEDSLWQGTPLRSEIISALSIVKVYGAGGQGPPYRWNYTLDEAPQWQGAPVNSKIISVLSAQRIFGTGGQVPPYRWNYTIDDPPSWQWPLYTINVNTHGLLTAPTPFENRQTYWYSEDAYWVGSPSRSQAIPLLSVQSIYGKGGQVPPFRWNATLDEPGVWGPKPVGVAQGLLAAAPPTPRIPRFPYAPVDDPPTWQWTLAERNRLILQPSAMPPQHGPPGWYSEDSFWSGVPTRSRIMAMLSAQRIYGQGGQVPPIHERFVLDDPPVWRGEPRRSVTISLLSGTRFYGQGGEALPRFWHYDYDDPPPWTRPLELNLGLVLSVVVPPPPPVAGVLIASTVVEYALRSDTSVGGWMSVTELEQMLRSATTVDAYGTVVTVEEIGSGTKVN